MSISIKVHGGTLGSVNLCAHCEHAQYMINDANQPVVYCGSIDKFIAHKIVSCTAHKPKGASQADYALVRRAWEITVVDAGAVRVDIPHGSSTIYKDGKAVIRDGKRIRPRKFMRRSEV